MKFDANKFVNGGLAANVGIRDGYSNVRFVGLLCAATDEEDGSVNYFTINKDGKALSAYNQTHAALSFELVNQGETIDSGCPLCEAEAKASQKPDVVRVLRYFRRFNYDLNQIQSSGGLTVGVEMNYRTNLMKVFPAFCSDKENFDKALGQVFVLEAIVGSSGIIFEFNKNVSIQENLARAVHTGEYKFLTNDFAEIERIKRGFARVIKPYGQDCSPIL